MKFAMTLEEALEFADEWVRGITFHEGSQGWRVVCMLLAEEVRRRNGIGGNLIIARMERDNLTEQLKQVKAQRDDLLETLESAYNIAVEHDGLFPFDWAVYCEMLHAAIVRAKSGGHPEEQAETAIPSLIFYPAGSLGEEVAE